MKYLFALIILISVISCSDDKNKRTWTNEDDSSFTDMSINGASDNKDITKYDATNVNEIENNLNSIENEIIQINSPEKLMECKQIYDSYISHTSTAISSVSDSNNKQEIANHFNTVKALYDKKIKDYSLPAKSIIQNIDIQTKNLENCSSKSELLGILNSRYSYFKNLSKLHLIVEESNRQSEVRELASKLQELFNAKIEQFDVDFK